MQLNKHSLSKRKFPVQSASFVSSPLVYIGQMIPGGRGDGRELAAVSKTGTPADLVLYVSFPHQLCHTDSCGNE